MQSCLMTNSVQACSPRLMESALSRFIEPLHAPTTLPGVILHGYEANLGPKCVHYGDPPWIRSKPGTKVTARGDPQVTARGDPPWIRSKPGTKVRAPAPLRLVCAQTLCAPNQGAWSRPVYTKWMQPAHTPSFPRASQRATGAPPS